jgi:dTDP-4-dehydrorhamnose reductase
VRVDAIIHCAAYTRVDEAEENQQLCYNTNVLATRYLIEQAIQQEAKFIYISTDYVFSGDKEAPYKTEDMPNPKSVYGQSKRLGEIEALRHSQTFIVRVSWVFGANGTNFVKTMLRLAKERTELNVVSDQLGSPTYTKDLALLLLNMIKTEAYGVYHATNDGFCSWYEFAKAIFTLKNQSINIYPVETSMYPTKASRPLNSRLDKASLNRGGFDRLPPWQDALRRFLEEVGEL